MSEFTRRDVEFIAEHLSYTGFFKIRSIELRHRLYDGSWSRVIKREVVGRSDAVGVLLLDPHLAKVALIEQFRIGAYIADKCSPWLLELVAGHIEEGEDPQQVARRESLEEAGCHIRDLIFIRRYLSSPGGSRECFHLYCGISDLSQAGGVYGLAEEDEDIKLVLLKISDAFDILASQALSNAHTIIALEWLRNNYQAVSQRYA